MENKTKLTNIIPLFLLVFFIWPTNQAFAQEDDGYFGTRCNVWVNFLDEFDRWIYMSGLRDGLIFSRLEVRGVKIEMSNESAVQGVNWLCNDPANVNIPIPFMLQIAAMRSSGWPHQQIEEELIYFRTESRVD